MQDLASEFSKIFRG